jgi:hypothetical protein
MKVCKECGKKYTKCCETSTKYCSDECRKRKRDRFQKNKRHEIKTNPEKYLDTILNRIYYTYKSSAFRTGRSFELTKEEMFNYYQNNCFYCGDKIDTIGLDRKDSNIGYIKSNIVPCCRTCNWMKTSQSPDDFINRCKKIANNNTL